MRPMGTFPDGRSALMLMARLRHVAGIGHAALFGHEQAGQSEQSDVNVPIRLGFTWGEPSATQSMLQQE